MERASTRARWVGTALGLLLAASSAGAQDFNVIDRIVVEGDTLAFVNVTIQRTGPGPDTDVFWRTTQGSATADVDYTTVTSGSVHFGPSDVFKSVSVEVKGDLTDEWSGILKDEVFFVDLTSVAGVGSIQKGRGAVTLVDDDRNQPGVQFLSVVSDGNASEGRNRLQWRVPAGDPNAPAQIHIRWNKGTSTCNYPANTGDGTPGPFLTANPPGTVQSFVHSTSLPHELYCYSVFTLYPAATAEIGRVTARTFDAGAGPLKWTHTNSAVLPSVAPPTVGTDAIYTVDNDGVVHAMQRGDGGGIWPTTPLQWNPVSLGRPADNRSPVVPWPTVATGSRYFVSTQNGDVHAVDGRSGAIVWSRSAFYGGGQLPGIGVQAPQAGLFKAFGGQNDMMLVGTNSGSNQFLALDPRTGFGLASYPNASMGAVRGMAVVDYAANRVYFGTSSSSATVFALDLGPSGTPSLGLSALPWNPKALNSPANSSPVMRGGRLYLATADGKVHSLRLSDGFLCDLDLGDGEVKGFMFPDRRNGNLYASTTDKVWAVQDDLEPADPNLSVLWSIDDIPSPSIVLHRPGTDLLYVGGGDGRLYQINVADPDPKATKKWVLLEAGSQIGAPSLDVTFNHVLVGSATGVVRAVRVPLP